MTRTNSIIVRDLESNLELISGVIKSIDTVTPQVMIETKIVETDLNDNENLGIDWVLQATINGATKPTTFPFTSSGGILGTGTAHSTSEQQPHLFNSSGPGFTIRHHLRVLLMGRSMLPSYPPPCNF